MAKIVSGTNKTTFGTRKGGKSSKSKNRHDRKEKNYRGQGK